MRKISNVFMFLAVLLSGIMCVVVGVNHGENAGYSAPSVVAFISAIPFVIAIMICIVLAVFMRKKDKR